jgi:hypothetical protein
VKNKQFVCLIDNPVTFHREAWQDGIILSSISANLLMSSGFKGHRGIDFRLNVGLPWETGKIHLGREAAMHEVGH